jgi:hypothetical protein
MREELLAHLESAIADSAARVILAARSTLIDGAMPRR